MTILRLVLGGSPKGETSVTMQYVRWIAENMAGHEVRTLQIASRIAALERDEGKFEEVIEAVKEADAVLWAFPLYVFTVSSQYKRFIELIWERKAEGAFAGKYAASLSTSIHFYDHSGASVHPRSLRRPRHGLHRLLLAEDGRPAHERVQETAHPLRGRLGLGRGRGCRSLGKALPCRRSEAPLASAPRGTRPRRSPRTRLARQESPRPRRLSRARRSAQWLGASRAAAVSEAEVEVLALEDMGIKGGCMGCLKCGQANHCAYEGKDGFIDAFRSKVLAADLLVYAGTTRDRALSARWKAFFDRSFFNTHQSVLKGKQFLYLVSGPLSRLDNLRQTLQATSNGRAATSSTSFPTKPERVPSSTPS
jgi:multimeric flavodoxin WrbA